MHYDLTVFGVKEATRGFVEYLHAEVRRVDLLVTIGDKVLAKNHVAGFAALADFARAGGVPVFSTDAYACDDTRCRDFFGNNTFDLGICVGWQRLFPKWLLDRFRHGIFGFHGSCGYLPFGRGRSPLNWSLIRGDTRFILNLFRYDEMPDSPNVFKNMMFEINATDDIATLEYKSAWVWRKLARCLLDAYASGEINVKSDSKDFDSWYAKRTPDDGRLDFTARTRDIYNLVRATTRPFSGAFAYLEEVKVVIWAASPFDSILDFSGFSPGEVIDVFDDRPVIRTVDGSLLVREYESGTVLRPGMRLR